MVCISGNSHQEDSLGSSRAAWIGAPVAEQQRSKKGAFCRFWPKFEIPKKWFYGRTNESRKTVPSPGSSQWWAALACTIAAWIFGKLAEWEQKISLMRLVLLDKNCTRQNGILGEPRRLAQWFAYLATLTRKSAWAAVEQHGLVHQWRSSSRPKENRYSVFDQNSRFQKMVLRTNEREQENRSYPWQFAVVSSTGLYYSSTFTAKRSFFGPLLLRHWWRQSGQQ